MKVELDIGTARLPTNPLTIATADHLEWEYAVASRNIYDTLTDQPDGDDSDEDHRQ